MAQQSNQTKFPRNHPSLEKKTQHVDQPSIYLQESKNRLVSYTEEKAKKSRLENFQIENHEDKIEEQEFENVNLEVVTSEEKSNKEDEKEVSNTEQEINDTLVEVEESSNRQRTWSE